MSITNTHKKYRVIIMPLIALWLLCQSMVLCAGGMNGHGSHEQGAYEAGNAANAMPHDHSHMQHASEMTHSAEFGHHMPNADSHGNVSQDSSSLNTSSCCEQHENYLPNVPISIFVALIVFFIIARLIDLVRSKSKQSHYFEAPPPRFTYPQNYVLHCAYLN